MVDVKMIEKTNKINLLFDFYGPLLTIKQGEAIKLYYVEDYSLAEIAEKLNISRQGVYDLLKRGEEALINYEKKLGLLKRFKEYKEVVLELKETLESSSDEVVRERSLELLEELLGRG